MSIKTVTKHRVSKTLVIWCFSSMSNRTVTKHSFVKYIEINCFSSMSNRTVTKPRHGPAPDLLALASG